jgi:hypothetical protein
MGIGAAAPLGAAMKGRNDAVVFLVQRGADLAQKDRGNRDTDKATSSAAPPSLAGDRLRRRPRARRRAVGC